MRAIATALLALTVLGACSKTEAPAAPQAPAAPPAAMIGGIDLVQPIRVIGTEPFFGVDIAHETLVFDRAGEAQINAPASGPVVTGTTAVYSGTTNTGQTLVVTLIATQCSDGMSDRTYALTAKVELGETSWNGCADTVLALSKMPPA